MPRWTRILPRPQFQNLRVSVFWFRLKAKAGHQDFIREAFGTLISIPETRTLRLLPRKTQKNNGFNGDAQSVGDLSDFEDVLTEDGTVPF